MTGRRRRRRRGRRRRSGSGSGSGQQHLTQVLFGGALEQALRELRAVEVSGVRV